MKDDKRPTLEELQQALQKFKTKYEKSDHILACNHEDLLILLNEDMPDEFPLKEDLWDRFWNDEMNWRDKRLQPGLLEFELIIQRNMINQKVEMVQKLKEGSTGWQRWNWLLERKFPEWGRLAPRKPQPYESINEEFVYETENPTDNAAQEPNSEKPQEV